MKKLLLFSLLGLTVFGRNAYSQTRTCDLELKFNTPYNNQTFAPGDSVPVTFKLINHGPDSLLPSDTVFIFFNFYTPANTYFYLNHGIASDDSEVSFPYARFYNDNSGEDSVMLCAHLDAQTNFIDPNHSNDTPGCIHFIMLSHNNSIEPSGVSKNTLALYPNPAKTFTHLQLSLKQVEQVVLKLTDVTGRIVFYKDYGLLQGNKDLKINVSDLAAGMYFVHLSQGSQQITRALLIQ